MAALDRERISRFLVEIQESKQVLADLTSGHVSEFVIDTVKVRAMKYTLIILVEVICNLCRHILAKKANTVVEEYLEAITRMQEKGMLSTELTNRLVPLTKLRHQLIHGYWKTDDQRLFAETKSSLGIIDQFVEEVHRIMAENKS